MPFSLDDALLAGGTLAQGLMPKSNGQYLQEHGSALANRSAETDLADRAARLPIRGMAIDRLLGPQAQRQNLNSMFADEGNPYARSLDHPVLPPIPDAPGSGGYGGGPMSGGPSNGNSVGQQYTDTVRSTGALPTGLPGDFRTGSETDRAAYAGPSTGHMGSVLARFAEEAKQKLAAQSAAQATRPAGGYYG